MSCDIALSYDLDSTRVFQGAVSDVQAEYDILSVPSCFGLTDNGRIRMEGERRVIRHTTKVYGY